MTPPLPRTHPGIFGLAQDNTNTISWLSSVYEVLDAPPASRPKDGWMGSAGPFTAVEHGLEIAGPYAASSMRRISSSAGSSGTRSTEASESPVAGTVEPKPKTMAGAGETTPRAKPRRKFNRDKVDSARYLIVPGHESEMQAAVAQLEGSSVCLKDRLSQMQEAIAQLENGSGCAPLLLLHQTDPSRPLAPGEAVDGESAEAKPKDEVPASPYPSRRNSHFMFTPSELMDAHQRWNNLMEARQSGSPAKPVSYSLTSKDMETAHRRGLKAARESRDLGGEMAGLVDDLVDDLDLSSDPQFCALR